MSETVSTEEMIEQLKKSFPSVKFRAGSVGFGIFYGHKSAIFPYTVFNDPNFPDKFARAVTILEITPCEHDSSTFFDIWEDSV